MTRSFSFVQVSFSHATFCIHRKLAASPTTIITWRGATLICIYNARINCAPSSSWGVFLSKLIVNVYTIQSNTTVAIYIRMHGIWVLHVSILLSSVAHRHFTTVWKRGNCLAVRVCGSALMLVTGITDWIWMVYVRPPYRITWELINCRLKYHNFNCSENIRGLWWQIKHDEAYHCCGKQNSGKL
jgi:hypothetical protein